MSLRIFVGKTYTVREACQVLLLLLIPSVLFLTNFTVWDDPYIFERHAHWSWDALFGAYMVNTSSYWRPLTVLTIAVPNLLGLSIWANKLISILLFFVQSSAALALLNSLMLASQPTRYSSSLIALACLIGLHPLFVEEMLWISARADLLMGIFVMLGTLWLSSLRIRQRNELLPGSNLRGFSIGFILIWLACASKDTAIVWTGIGLVTVIGFSLQSREVWRNYWFASSAGIASAIITYLAARGAVLGHVNGIPNLIARHAMSASDDLRFFAEFIVRSIFSILLPYFDQAPYKSAGWFSNTPLISAALILLVCTISIASIVTHLYQRSKTAGYLVLCALAVIVFHGVLSISSELTLGSIVSDRYLAPSALLIFVALAAALQGPARLAPTGRMSISTVVVIAFFGLLLIQSLILWSGARANWSSNLVLWGSSWDHDSRSRIVAENYSRSFFHLHDFFSERRIAQSWLAANPAEPPKAEYCKLYVSVMEADVALGDQADGVQYANRALPIGACRLAMVQHLTYFLLKHQCKDVLPVLYQAIAEGDKPKDIGTWQFLYPTQKEALLVNAAWGEAHCGDPNKALQILKTLSLTNQAWRIEGDAAKTLLHDAANSP